MLIAVHALLDNLSVDMSDKYPSSEAPLLYTSASLNSEASLDDHAAPITSSR